MNTSRAGKLKRLLDLIPLLFENQGIALADLQTLAGFQKRSDLIEGLSKLLMMGVPPFSPADFIDVFWDNEDRVYLEFPQGLDRPLALTPGEWAAVQKVLARQGEVVEAGQKSGVLNGLFARFSSVPILDEKSDPFQSKRALVEEALADRSQIEFLYRTLSSPEPEIRRVDPWILFSHRGVTYLIAYCYLREAPRHFHLERMEDVEILAVAQTTTPPTDLSAFMKQSPIFNPEPAGFTVRLAFAPALRSPLEQFFRLRTTGPFSAPDAEGPENAAFFAGWLEGQCKVRESIWFRATLRSLGPGTLILSPAHLRSAYLADLARIEEPAGLD